MSEHHVGHTITQSGSHNSIGNIGGVSTSSVNGALADLVDAVDALSRHVSVEDRELLRASMSTVTDPRPDKSAVNRALRSIGGIAAIVGQVGAPVLAAIGKVTAALLG